jgi:hypothetical protein
MLVYSSMRPSPIKGQNLIIKRVQDDDDDDVGFRVSDNEGSADQLKTIKLENIVSVRGSDNAVKGFRVWILSGGYPELIARGRADCEEFRSRNR